MPIWLKSYCDLRVEYLYYYKRKNSSRLPDFVLTATSLSKIGDGSEFGVNRTRVEPTIVDVADGFLSIFLFFELRKSQVTVSRVIN